MQEFQFIAWSALASEHVNWLYPEELLFEWALNMSECAYYV